MIGVRASLELRGAIEAWAQRRTDKPVLSEAIRQLIELGLSTSASARPHSPKARAKAADMAHEVIDRHADPSATPEEHASRKRRLLKGPKEFREWRRDRATPKGKA